MKSWVGLNVTNLIARGFKTSTIHDLLYVSEQMGYRKEDLPNLAPAVGGLGREGDIFDTLHLVN